VYGVHGYGRGHAARALAVLPELMRRHDVLVLAGDEAYEQLHELCPTVRIPVLRYYHDARGRRSVRLTLKRAIPAFADLALQGPICQMVMTEIRGFSADVVISDSEGWTHRAARALGIPRISFDHYGVMAYCDLGLSARERLACRAESVVYRYLACDPERIIAVAFYPGGPRRRGMRVVGPILREAVRETNPSEGDYLLAYFSNASVNYTPQVDQALRELECPVKVYGTGRDGTEGNVEFRPIAKLPFVRDLAGCRAVFATAGNQLISEAIHFGKPMLLMPEESLEQQLNARIVRRWGIGMETRPRRVSASQVKSFLAQRDALARAIDSHRRDGLSEAMDALETGIAELTAKSPPHYRLISPPSR
jgi:uncharacterized protein (TIGR00661 family)